MMEQITVLSSSPFWWLTAARTPDSFLTLYLLQEKETRIQGHEKG